jgi:pimeloyl-ACP methyl ester carboxylesterase
METAVTFLSHGEPICGMLHLPESLPAAAVVMCHGFTGNKSEAHRLFVTAARDFCAHGLVVLRFDFRGSGDSAGEFRDMTISREIEDAEAALAFLASRPEVTARRIGALGLSMGGCVAACLSGRTDQVRALVLWSATAHPDRIFDRLFPDFGVKPMIDMNGWGLGRTFIEDARTMQPLDEVRNYRGPSLVVHGTNDATVPPGDASDYRIALGGQCRLHYVQGADHTFARLDWQGEAVSLSRDFLLGTLTGAAGG